jgi:hypothetical protein
MYTVTTENPDGSVVDVTRFLTFDAAMEYTEAVGLCGEWIVTLKNAITRKILSRWENGHHAV